MACGGILRTIVILSCSTVLIAIFKICIHSSLVKCYFDFTLFSFQEATTLAATTFKASNDDKKPVAVNGK